MLVLLNGETNMNKKLSVKTFVIFIFIFFTFTAVMFAFIVNLANGFKPINSVDLLDFYGESKKQPFSMVMGQDPLVAEMIQNISENNIYNSVYTLQNFTTRFYGTSSNIAASTWLFNKLDNISGLSVEFQGGEEFRNIIATLPGIDGNSTGIYMVGAHYDTVDLSFAPGATDNGGGVAIVLEIARIMSQYTFNHTLMFALWDAEEEGGASMKGSKAYTDYAFENNLDIELYVNFDSSCYDPDDDFVLDIMYNDQSSWVKDIMSEYNSLYNIGFTLTYNIHSCLSDHRYFWSHGYTAVMTHEEYHGPAHSEYDTVDKVNTLYALKNGQLGMSILAKLVEIQHHL